MYGEKRELVRFECRDCGTPCPVWVDREDLACEPRLISAARIYDPHRATLLDPGGT